MGIIKRQTIFSTIITYFAVLIGFVNSAILLPKIDIEIVGLVNILVSYTIIISVFGNLGFNAVTTRLFPYFRNKENHHNGFMFVGIVVTLVGFILAIGVILIVKHFIVSNRPSGNLFVTYYNYLYLLVFFTLIFNLIDNYYKANFRSVRGTALKEFVPKFSIMIVLLLMVLSIFNTNQFVFWYCIALSLGGILFLIIASLEGDLIVKPKLSFIDKNLKRSMISVGSFGILSSATGMLAINVDRLMIESMLGLSATGIYSIAFYFGAIISIPSRALANISSSVIAESWKSNNIENISLIYRKSTINQFIIGGILLIGIIINLENIFILLTDVYRPGKWVVVLIGITFLLDMLSGSGSQIIINSKYYKDQAILIMGFVICIICSNYFLISMYGITGAAIATLISKILFNLAKIILIKIRFNLQPYNKSFLLVLGLLLLLLLINSIIPTLPNFIYDIALRSSIISLAYIVAIYFLNISEDYSSIINKIISKIRLTH